MEQGPSAARANATTAGESDPTSRIGPWDVVGELGRGAMGVVLRARHHQTGQPVALKLLPPHLAAVSDFALRFDVEARAAARLRHPAVVAVVDAGEHGGQRWLAMELVDGVPLDAHLRQHGPLPEAQAAELGARLARGLAHAHALDVLHRDIKPSNVLLGTDGPRLADFGLAKLTDPGAGRLTLSGEVLGTPPYMSPEQAVGRPIDARSDVYQLGATIYHTLAGQPPFLGAHPLEVMTAVATRPPTPLETLRPGVDPALAQLVRRAMAPRLAERLPSAAALADELEGWLRQPRTRAEGGSPGLGQAFGVAGERRRPGRRLRRSRRRWAVAGAALLLLAAGLAWGIQARRPVASPGPGTQQLPPPPTPTAPPPPAPPTEPVPAPASSPELELAAQADALLAHPGPPTAGEIAAALALAPRHGGALAARAALRLAEKDLRGALEDAEAAMRGRPHVTRASVARTLGLARFQLGQRREALPDLEVAFGAAPDDLEVASILGFAAREFQNPALAATAFRAARRVHRERGETPHWNLPFNLAGALATLVGDLPTADLREVEEAYREAHALAELQTPGVVWPLVRLSTILVGARRYDDAELCIAEADAVARRTGIKDYAVDVLNARVVLLSARGQTAEAVALAREGFAAYPGDMAPSLTLANALLADGQPEAALPHAQRAVQVAERDAGDKPNVVTQARAALQRVEAALAERAPPR